MDPVSLAASIITVISATSVTGNALARVWSLRRPPNYLASTINEVTDLRATLRLVHSAVASTEGSLADEVQTEINGLLGRAKQKLDALDKHVHTDLLKRNTNPNCDKLALKRRAIVGEILGDNQRKLDVFRAELSSIRIGLGVALGAVNTIQLQQIPRMFMRIQQISLVQPSAPCIGLIGGTTVPARTVTEPSLGDSQSLHQSSQLEYLICDENTSTPISTDTTTHPNATHVSITTKVLDKTCKPHCPCQCHIPLQGSTPRWLRGLMGSLFFNFTGTPLLNHRSCNFSVCGAKDASSGSAYFQYYFPKWLLTKGVMIRGHWEDLGGIGATWTFRIPKAVTSSILNGELLSVGRYRPVMEVKQFMALNHIAAVDIDMTGESVFELAVNFWREDMCLLLLELGADLSYQTQHGIPLSRYFWKQALRFPTAHRENMFGTLQSLPEFEEELEIMNFNALHRIVLGLSAHNLRSQIELDPALVHARDCFGFTPLHWAAQRDDLDAINILLDAGADINAHCSQGRTPLSWAVWCGSFHCCKTLMDPSAHVKTAKPSGSNAIAGLRRGPVKTDTISLLLKRGADINMKDSNRGRTCLMESTVLGTASICETLLDHGADMELHNMSGSSAAFHAIYTNNPDVLKVLIRRGACLTFRDKLGRSIIDYTALYGGIEVMDILSQTQIDGLSLTDKDIEKSWAHFHDERDSHFFHGMRGSPDMERNAFHTLLDSFIVVQPPLGPRGAPTYDLPGSYPNRQMQASVEEAIEILRKDRERKPGLRDFVKRVMDYFETERQVEHETSQVLPRNFPPLQEGGEEGMYMRFHDMPGTFPSLQEDREPVFSASMVAWALPNDEEEEEEDNAAYQAMWSRLPSKT